MINLINKFKNAVCVSFLVAASFLSRAESYPLITNIGGRITSSLDGQWRYILDPMNRGTGSKYYNDTEYADKTKFQGYDFATAKTIAVPGDWNTQNPELLYYEGYIWYRKKFDYPRKEGTRLFLHFGAINYKATVYLNGKQLGKHEGGFTPFNYEVTSLIREKGNSLVVLANNIRVDDGNPSVVYDWWNFGGITRPVTLIETPVSFIRDYSLQLEKGKKNSLKGWVQLDGTPGQGKIRVEIPELKISRDFSPGTDGRALIEITAQPTLWSDKNPKMYSVIFAAGTDRIEEKIGFRTIEAKGKDLLLNGEKIFLRGVNIHAHIRGRSAYSREDAACLLGWAKEMGCNFVRLAHYPHSEEMVRVAEEMGIMVWEEIPVYWSIRWDNLDTYANAENQLDEIIARDKNRACVIIWSIANETPQESRERLDFLTRLANRTRTLDDHRLVSSAMMSREIKPNVRTITDKLTGVVDVIGFNQYIGWFGGTPEVCDSTQWEFTWDKPVLMTEFGSVAPYGNHGERNERYTEEFQAYYYERTLEMIKRISGLSGTCPWNLTEHRTPMRVLPNIEDGFSRAGLLSASGQKKKAYFLVKKWYDKMK